MNDPIQFVKADAEEISSAMIADYEQRSGRTLYPADPVRLLLLWAAAIDLAERENINEAARQNLPRYARGDYLDLLAELFRNVRRLPPKAAGTVLRFTRSIPRESATIIPAGTRATADGTLIFETVEELVIPPRAAAGEVPARCQTVGAAGNGLLPGQINRLVDVFPYFGGVENTIATAGGADTEGDAALYERMRESMETYSTAGPSGAYEYYARSASALVSDVKASSPAPGVVDVRVLLTGGQLPGEELLRQIEAVLTADEVRPLTDRVTVATPDRVNCAIDVTYYLQDGAEYSAQAAERAVAAAVEEYRAWQCARMGRDINPSRLHYLLMAAGIKRAEVRAPVFTPVADSAVAVVGEVRIVAGGLEDE